MWRSRSSFIADPLFCSLSSPHLAAVFKIKVTLDDQPRIDAQQRAPLPLTDRSARSVKRDVDAVQSSLQRENRTSEVETESTFIGCSSGQNSCRSHFRAKITAWPVEGERDNRISDRTVQGKRHMCGDWVAGADCGAGSAELNSSQFGAARIFGAR